jgi:trimethylamine---corrinoid protein Co-methyltransferase
VLQRTGVKITHPRALEILSSGAGARVNGDRVKIPGWLVEDAIRTAPSRIVLGTRTGERTVFPGGDKSFFGPSLDCVDYLDPKTHQRNALHQRQRQGPPPCATPCPTSSGA